MRKRGVDTNVLIYAHLASFPEHAAVRRFLLRELSDRDVRCVVTPMVLHEFVHVVTDARRFHRPVAMPEALAVARLYLEHENVECASVDGDALRDAFEWIERYKLGRKRIADTLLAATLIRCGAKEIITCNSDDFRVFDGLAALDPRDT